MVSQFLPRYIREFNSTFRIIICTYVTIDTTEGDNQKLSRKVKERTPIRYLNPLHEIQNEYTR